MPTSEVAVVVESWNESEHSSVERLAEALELAQQAAGDHGDARVVLADSGGNSDVAALVAERFPDVQRVTPGVEDYDAAKHVAAAAVDAHVIVYLDGDCRPTDRDWLRNLIAPIVDGNAVGTAGFTMYEGGWLARVLSVMDFGFLLPRSARPVGCYASNNSTFRADALACTPAPEGQVRCKCYAHAQLFERQGTPMQLAPDAFVYHEAVPFLQERMIRGWALVGAAHVDPHLPEARWLRLGVLATPLFYAKNVVFDTRRALAHGADFGLGALSRIAAVPVMAAVRLVDAGAMVAALRGKPVPEV